MGAHPSFLTQPWGALKMSHVRSGIKQFCPGTCIVLDFNARLQLVSLPPRRGYSLRPGVGREGIFRKTSHAAAKTPEVGNMFSGLYLPLKLHKAK